MRGRGWSFSILHIFRGYSALIISVHHAVTHRDYLDIKSDDDNATEQFLINGEKKKKKNSSKELLKAPPSS